MNKKRQELLNKRKEILISKYPNITDEDVDCISPFLYIPIKYKLVPVPNYWKSTNKKLSNFYNIQMKWGGKDVYYENNNYQTLKKMPNEDRPVTYDGTDDYSIKECIPGKISYELYTALGETLICLKENVSDENYQNPSSSESL